MRGAVAYLWRGHERLAPSDGEARGSIYSVRDGNTWPDFLTIIRLEICFDCLPGRYEHRRSPRQVTADRGAVDRHRFVARRITEADWMSSSPSEMTPEELCWSR